MACDSQQLSLNQMELCKAGERSLMQTMHVRRSSTQLNTQISSSHTMG